MSCQACQGNHGSYKEIGGISIQATNIHIGIVMNVIFATIERVCGSYLCLQCVHKCVYFLLQEFSFWFSFSIWNFIFMSDVFIDKVIDFL